MPSPDASARPAIRRHVIVAGRVQGVFFRDSTRREAERLGVAGWVRNVDDGTVEAVLEGEASAVEDRLAFCRRGPERARVDSLEVAEQGSKGSATSGFADLVGYVAPPEKRVRTGP